MIFVFNVSLNKFFKSFFGEKLNKTFEKISHIFFEKMILRKTVFFGQ